MPADDCPAQPPPQPGSIWWCRDTSACGVVVRANSRSVEVRILNRPRLRQRVTIEVFYSDWHRTPRIARHWYNRGSLWRRIDRNTSPTRLQRQTYELNGITSGGYTIWVENGPVSRLGGLGSISSFELASNYVRVWEEPWPNQPAPHSESSYSQTVRPQQAPVEYSPKFPEKPKKAKKKAKKKAPKRPSVFDRLSGEDLV